MLRGKSLASLLLALAEASEASRKDAIGSNQAAAGEQFPRLVHASDLAEMLRPAVNWDVSWDIPTAVVLDPLVVMHGTMYLTYAPSATEYIGLGVQDYLHVTATPVDMPQYARASEETAAVASSDAKATEKADPSESKDKNGVEEIVKSFAWSDVEARDIYSFIGFAVYLRFPHRNQKRRYGRVVQGKKVIYRWLQVLMGVFPYIGLEIQAVLCLWFRAAVKNMHSIWLAFPATVSFLVPWLLASIVYDCAEQYELGADRYVDSEDLSAQSKLISNNEPHADNENLSQQQ